MNWFVVFFSQNHNSVQSFVSKVGVIVKVINIQATGKKNIQGLPEIYIVYETKIFRKINILVIPILLVRHEFVSLVPKSYSGTLEGN